MPNQYVPLEGTVITDFASKGFGGFGLKLAVVSLVFDQSLLL